MIQSNIIAFIEQARTEAVASFGEKLGHPRNPHDPRFSVCEL
jgi:hypothetical protein